MGMGRIIILDRILAYLFLAICLYSFISGCLCPHGITRHFIYIFFHANIFHLAGNMLCMVMLSARDRGVDALKSAAIAISVSFLPPYIDNTVGISAMLFSWVGLMNGRVRSFRPAAISLATVLS